MELTKDSVSSIVFWLKGSGSPDNALVARMRAALQV